MSAKELKVIVFDLDYTLWAFRVDKNAKSPFNRSENGNIVDMTGKTFHSNPGTVDLLKKLEREGYVLALASRIEDTCGAYQLLELFGLSNFFSYKEIYPGNKKAHFNQIKKKSGVEFREMLFFDDDKRNIRDVSNLGVTAIQVPDGCITLELLEAGIQTHLF